LMLASQYAQRIQVFRERFPGQHLLFKSHAG
jgi:hypothetical protein